MREFSLKTWRIFWELLPRDSDQRILSSASGRGFILHRFGRRRGAVDQTFSLVLCTEATVLEATRLGLWAGMDEYIYLPQLCYRLCLGCGQSGPARIYRWGVCGQWCFKRFMERDLFHLPKTDTRIA